MLTFRVVTCFKISWHIQENTQLLVYQISCLLATTRPFCCLRLKIKVCVTVILCGCKSWSVTFREERRLRALENGARRKTVGSKREEVTVDQRKMHDVVVVM